MEELCQPSINGRGGPIAPIPIQATYFGLRHHMIQQVQNTCQFHGLPGDDANRHIDRFLEITQHMKQNGVSDDALHLSLFLYSLTHHAIAWYDHLPRNFIHSFDDMMRKFLSKYFPPSMVTKLRNEITKFEQKPYKSLFEAWERYKLSNDRSIRDETSRNISSTSTTESLEVVRQLEMMNTKFSEMMRQFQMVKAIDTKCETCGGPHYFTECSGVGGYTQDTAYATTGMGSLPSNTVPNPQEDLKAITTQSGVTLAGPSISPSSFSKESSLAFTYFSTISSSKMPEVTKDMCISTRSNSSHLFSPLRDLESLIRRRNLGEPSSLFNFKEVINNNPNQEPPPHNGPSPMVRPNGQAPRTMEELCQPSINGRGGPIALIPIQATYFGLRHHMIQQVQNTCQFHGLPGDDANRHIDKFLEITQHMKQNGVFDDALYLSLFLYSLTHHAIAWYDRLPRNFIHSFDDMMRKFLSKYFPPSMVTKLRNEITKFEQKPYKSLFEAWEQMMRQFQMVKAIDTKCETCGGPHYFTECPGVGGYTQETAYATTGLGSLPSNTVPNPREDLKAITTQSCVTLAGPSISPSSFSKESSLAFTYFSTISSSKMPEVTKDMVQPIVDYVVNPRVPLILGRPFLRTGRASIDVYGEELTLRVDDEAITFKVGQTSKYSYNVAESINQIDVACEEYVQEGIDPRFYTHKILMEDDFKPTVQHQRRVNPKIHEVIKKEVIKLLDAGMIYPVFDSPWVSLVHCVPKMGGMTIVENENNELIPTRFVTGWRVCIDYRKLNDATRKDHFPLPFMDQMLERLAGNEFYCFLDGFSGYFQIPINPQDQEKTNFACPYEIFPYRRMPFGLCNASGTFQRYMMAIFHDMNKKTMEVFLDDFSVFRDSFSSCISYLDTMLQRCKDTNLVLNWEKYHFIVKEGIVLGHKISKNRLEVDQAKIDVIAKLPHSTTVKGVRSFLGHAGFYRRFIQYFFEIVRPMTHLIEKETPFVFSKECIDAFETLKKKLTEAPILVVPD
uniref:Reverse transcriptase domain-containing protein n=1 Tax=Tanacetum cinerariifolium TaxID=118510 RepID=A0A6L2L1Y2_TANCI|nr:reverse transcriptase domain-containing protein [Tanacetum cinerariifolium]